MLWVGGKARIAHWVIDHFPPHKIYVEPFGGSAAVLLAKPPSKVEIYNDKDARLVALFRVLRNPKLAKQLARALELTPYHEAEYRSAWEVSTDRDPIEQARRIVVQLRMSFGGAGSRGTPPGFGFGINSSRAQTFVSAVAALPIVADRFRRVTVMSRDAIDLLSRFDTPDTLFYLDPPYVPDTRSKSRDYIHDMTLEHHETLLKSIKRVSGKVILSGYPSELYDTALKKWRRVEREVYLHVARDKGQRRNEALWLNF